MGLTTQGIVMTKRVVCRVIRSAPLSNADTGGPNPPKVWPMNLYSKRAEGSRLSALFSPALYQPQPPRGIFIDLRI